MQCNFRLPWKWPVLYALWEQGKIIVSWNSCIQHILSAHPVPVTSGPQGHSGKPGDNMPIGTGLSLISKIDGSHAVANISKCYQENKAWWGEDSDGCRVIKRPCSKEVTQTWRRRRHESSRGTMKPGDKARGWGRAWRGQQTSVRGPGRRWPTWDPLWVPPPGAWAFVQRSGVTWFLYLQGHSATLENGQRLGLSEGCQGWPGQSRHWLGRGP